MECVLSALPYTKILENSTHDPDIKLGINICAKKLWPEEYVISAPFRIEFENNILLYNQSSLTKISVMIILTTSAFPRKFTFFEKKYNRFVHIILIFFKI